MSSIEYFLDDADHADLDTIVSKIEDGNFKNIEVVLEKQGKEYIVFITKKNGKYTIESEEDNSKETLDTKEKLIETIKNKRDSEILGNLAKILGTRTKPVNIQPSNASDDYHNEIYNQPIRIPKGKREGGRKLTKKSKSKSRKTRKSRKL